MIPGWFSRRGTGSEGKGETHCESSGTQAAEDHRPSHTADLEPSEPKPRMVGSTPLKPSEESPPAFAVSLLLSLSLEA